MMGISHETQQKIKQFAGEESQHYLEEAEMTYLEKLRRRSGQTRQKIGSKLARFKSSSVKGREAQDDMILYMNDYINDLMSRGLSEQEAFEKAKEELSSSDDTGSHCDFQERLRQHYENRDPDVYEMNGLFYGGFVIAGIAMGALAGFVSGGGRPAFLSGGWIDTLIGAGAGMFLGVALGMVSNAFALAFRKRK